MSNSQYKPAQEKRDEQTIRRLQKIFRNHGITVRRENLSRGPSFRVRSGDCVLTGERFVFVDRRMPADQQLGTLLDQLVSYKLQLTEDELEDLPSTARAVLERVVEEVSDDKSCTIS